MLLVIHYEEIALKGKNRGWFENKLVNNIRLALQGLEQKIDIHKRRCRLVLDIAAPVSWEEIVSRLTPIPGIAYFAPILQCQADMEVVKTAIREHLHLGGARNFAVRCKRENKKFPLKTPEIERELGRLVQTHTGLPVNLTSPDLTLNIEWLSDGVLIFWQRYPGPCGLPIGTSGKVLCLLSGGIDSPVAAYLMMRRGCVPVFLHFHSFPFTDTASQQKVEELARVLCRYRCESKLYLVPFAELQKEIVIAAPSPYRIILYRRFMLRLAEQIARQEKAEALVTGESLGQVASQTLPNLATIQAVAALPVLRPLIGMTKNEIITWSRRIQTFSLSIQPHSDCCSFLMPRNPRTHSFPSELQAIERQLESETVFQQTLQQTECRHIPPCQ